MDTFKSTDYSHIFYLSTLCFKSYDTDLLAGRGRAISARCLGAPRILSAFAPMRAAPHRHTPCTACRGVDGLTSHDEFVCYDSQLVTPSRTSVFLLYPLLCSITPNHHLTVFD